MRLQPINLQDLDHIVSQSEIFYKKSEIIEVKNKKYKFSIYNYRLADLSEFEKYSPLSFELRGLAVSENNNHFLSVHKFFNHKENYLVEDDLDGELEIREKYDGSLILPIIVSDEVVFRTKGTFYSDQAKQAQSKLDSKLKKFILDLYYYHGLIPIFEFISPDNQIVVRYPTDELVLIQIRDNNTGKYLEYGEMKKLYSKYNLDIPIVSVTQTDIDTLLENSKEIENIEGYVIQKRNLEYYTDMRKIKTMWYLQLHKVLSPDSFRDNVLVKLILQEKIDDVLSNASVGKREYVEKLITLLSKYINKHIRFISHTIEQDGNLFRTNPKTFVEKYRNYTLFPILMKAIRLSLDQISIVNEIKKYILLKTQKLENATYFIKNELEKEE